MSVSPEVNLEVSDDVSGSGGKRGVYQGVFDNLGPG